MQLPNCKSYYQFHFISALNVEFILWAIFVCVCNEMKEKEVSYVCRSEMRPLPVADREVCGGGLSLCLSAPEDKSNNSLTHVLVNY